MISVDKKYFKGLKFIDLFAGLGGFRLALESLGAECVYSSDWDIPVQEVYFNNFGERPDGDITKVNEKDIPDHDILCAGFPCQAFSISGRQRGFEDSRGTLFFDVARIVKEKRPKVVFMENVKNFAAHDGGKTLEVVEATMKSLGYSFNKKVLNAADFGIPQKRERIYMVCFRNDIKARDFSFPKMCIRDSGKVFYYSRRGFFIVAFFIAALADFRRSFKINEDKTVAYYFGGVFSVIFYGRNKRNQRNKPRVVHEFCYFRGSADIFGSVAVGKTEVGIKSCA